MDLELKVRDIILPLVQLWNQQLLSQIFVDNNAKDIIRLSISKLMTNRLI